jgi:hypothetical protein
MILNLKPGRVFVGMNLPFFLPEAMIESKLRAFGFTNFTWFSRADDLERLSVIPTADPQYTDDWNRWLEADFTGPPKTIDEKKVWSWLVQKPQ